MRAALLARPGELSIVEIPRPSPGPGEVVVRVSAALLCGTDVKTYRRGHRILPLPAVIGHELAGVVEAVGEGVREFSVGEAVVPAVSGPCGGCDPCRRGHRNLCTTLMAPGEKTWGAFAEAVSVPARVVRTNLHRVPQGIPPAEAALLDPLASVLHAWSRLPDPAGRAVAVVGAGALGLLHVLVAKDRGAASVAVLGRHAARLGRARELGADVVAELPDELPPADVVVECAGTVEAWDLASRLAAPGGTVCLFGGCPSGSRASFDTGRLHYDEVSLVGAFHYTPEDARAALALIATRRLPLASLLTGPSPLEALPELLSRTEPPLREVIVP